MADSILTVQAIDSMELAANRADVHVTIKGSSLVRASVALERAREVAQFVEAVQTIGIPANAIQVERVQMDIGSGTLLKSTTAVYSLRLRNVELDLIPDVLAEIVGQKHITLERCDWLYPDADDERNALLTTCIQKAMKKAHSAANALGIELGAVANLQEHFSDEESERDLARGKRSAASFGYAAGQTRNDINNLPVGDYKRVYVEVKLSYHIVTPAQPTIPDAHDDGADQEE